MSGHGTVSGDSSTEARVLACIRGHNDGTWIEEVARELRISRLTVSRYVTALERTGIIHVKREGTMKRLYSKAAGHARGRN